MKTQLAETNVLEALEDSVVFTIISNNYIHYARALKKSLQESNPELDLVIFVVDKENIALYDDLNIVNINQLNIPNLNKFLFRYSILEANTAIKPWCFEYLFKKFNHVLYLDPDIYVYKSLDILKNETLCQKLMLLTPHILHPILDNKTPSEQSFLKAGIYNLGFLMLNKHPSLNNFIEWWKSKLETLCLNRQAEGLFVDQKWMDLAPSLFEDVYILKDYGYNIAYWNLQERSTDNVVFVHYSGICEDVLTTGSISKHQTRFAISGIGKFAKLYLDYWKLINIRTEIFEYYYDLFNNGVVISQQMRDIYNFGDMSKIITDPFNESDFFDKIIDKQIKDIIGLHNIEYSSISNYRWMSKYVFVKLQDEATKFTIKINHNIAYISNLELKFVLDGKIIHSQIIANNINIISFNLPENASKILQIIASNTFFPKDFNLEDDRELSVMVQYIGTNVGLILDNQVNKNFHSKPTIQAVGYCNHATGVGKWLRNFTDAIKIKKTTNIDNLLDFNEDINIFFINGDTNIGSILDYSNIKNKYNIGVWCWELENFPNEWVYNSKILNEVWGISLFTTQSIAKSLYIPCITMPACIEFNVEAANKKMYNIPQKFIFLNIFDDNSISERKNPIQLIETFKKTFKYRSDVCLIIKTNTSKLDKYAIKDKVIIINEILTEQSIYNLHNCADCFISLHRAEGFGLNLAESMYLGKPVIATGWSGNLDFMNNQNSFLVDYTLVKVGDNNQPYKSNEYWAQPDLEHAGELMDFVLNNNTTKKSKLGQETIKSKYNKNTVSRFLEERIQAIVKKPQILR